MDGRLSGVVEGVELDSAGRAMSVVVHRRGRAPLELGRASIAAVYPWQRLVVVTLPARDPKAARAARAASETAARSGQAAWTGAARSGQAAWAGAARGGQAAWAGAARAGAASAGAAVAARRVLPPARRFALWLGARTALAVAVAGWLYSVAVFSVSRVVVRLLLATLSFVVRAGAVIAPPLAHTARKATRKALQPLTGPR